MSWLKRTARNVGLVVTAPSRLILKADGALGNPVQKFTGIPIQNSPLLSVFAEGGILGKGASSSSSMYSQISGVNPFSSASQAPVTDSGEPSKQKNQQVLLVLGAVFVGLLVLFNPDSPTPRRKRRTASRARIGRTLATRRRVGRKKSVSEIKAERLRNLAKARRAKRAKAKR